MFALLPIAPTFSSFLDKPSLWNLCKVSHCFHTCFLRFAIALTKWKWHMIPTSDWFKFITQLVISNPLVPINMQEFPKLQSLRIDGCICDLRFLLSYYPFPLSLTDLRIANRCDIFQSRCLVERDFPWPTTLKSLKLDRSVAQPFESFPPLLEFLDLDYNQTAIKSLRDIPPTIVSLRLWAHRKPLALEIPQCSLISLRAAEWNGHSISKDTLHSTLTYLNLPHFTGTIEVDALPKCLIVLKLPRFKGLVPHLPHSITCLTLGVIPLSFEYPLPIHLRFIQPLQRRKIRVDYYKWSIARK